MMVHSGPPLAWVAAFAFVLQGCAASMGAPTTVKCGPDRTPCSASPYADTAWATVHASPRNDDYVPIELSGRYERYWSVLEGYATLMSPSLGPDGHIYVTTPSEQGTSTLHAFAPDGLPIWESKPWLGPNDLDSCAGFQTPIVDEDGDLYLSDCNQVWSVTSKGRVRWVVDLPKPPPGTAWQYGLAGPVNPFVTAFFTRDGAVGGVTMWGDIVLLSRHDGRLVAAPTRMPGSTALREDELPRGLGVEPPPGVWTGGFMDPEMIPVVWYLFEGVVPSANTPAMDPATGRFFVTGLSRSLDDDRGALYAFDFIPGRDGKLGHVDVAFEFMIGGGSGSSPGISPDGATVYVSDGAGVLYAVDARTGGAKWSLPTSSQQASPSVGADGMIYLLGGKAGFAVHPNGTEAWTANLDSLAESHVPPLQAESPLSGPSTFHNAVPTITKSGVLTSVTVGYLASLGALTVIPVAVSQFVVLLDRQTGALVDNFQPIRLTDTVEGFVVATSDGLLLANQGALVSTTLRSLAGSFEPLLPNGVSLIPPVGGLQAFRPASEHRASRGP